MVINIMVINIMVINKCNSKNTLNYNSIFNKDYVII